MKVMSQVSQNRALAIGAFFLLFGITAYYNMPTPPSEKVEFGWEYGNIAEAIVRGKGFANPFGFESGPTAWMPPLFVYLLAGTFYLFGIRSMAAVWAILLTKSIALAACFYFLLTAARHSGFQKYKYILVPVFFLFFLINRGPYFKTIHDEWLILFLSCAMVSAFTTRIDQPSRSNTIFLCILAFALPLASPALALSFAVVELGIFLWHKPRSSSPRSRWLPTLLVLNFLAASTLLWTYRNYREFGKFIPIKSNLWFDFYQANVLDEDGLVTNTTFIKFHPIRKNEMQEKYLMEKEVQFMQDAEEASLQWIRADPFCLLQNTGRRAISAFLYMHNVEDTQRVKPGLLSPEDLEKLASAKLISLNEAPTIYWISLTVPPSAFEQQIHALNLSNEASILQDWSARRQTLINWVNDPRRIIRSFLISFIPTLCLLCGLMVARVRKNPLFMIAVTIYLTYLTPYILVSYYRRYQVPLIGLISIFISFFICILIEKFRLGEIRFLKSGWSKAKQ